MNEFKGTPGAWVKGHDGWINNEDGAPVVQCLNGGPSSADWTSEDDYTLAVVAPDLLKALMLARWYVAEELTNRRTAFLGYEGRTDIPAVEHDLYIVDAAIAKALGNQEVAK